MLGLQIPSLSLQHRRRLPPAIVGARSRHQGREARRGARAGETKWVAHLFFGLAPPPVVGSLKEKPKGKPHFWRGLLKIGHNPQVVQRACFFWSQ